ELGRLATGVVAVEGGLGEAVLLLAHGELGLAHPLRGLALGLGRLLLHQVLLGDGHRELRLHLDVLVVQIEHELVDHLFRVFRAIDEVVEVRADEHAHALQELHRVSPLSVGVTSVRGGVCRAGTRAKRSAIFTPASVSKRAGAWATIEAMSATILFAPAPSWPLPVDTMVILSTLARGSARARTTSGSPLSSLSMTAAWLYSWKAAALTFMASASASPLARMISASAVPLSRMTSASAVPC